MKRALDFFASTEAAAQQKASLQAQLAIANDDLDDEEAQEDQGERAQLLAEAGESGDPGAGGKGTSPAKKEEVKDG